MRPSMNKKCEVCEPVLVGMIWEMDGGEYTREMLRKCKVCRREMLTDLIWVDSQLPTCGACLSQELKFIPGSMSGKLECASCGSKNVITFNVEDDT